MSSFNRIGTVWAGGCYELLTEILRNEWGFCGAVITDYANAYMNPDQMIRAGGDLCLFQDQQPSARGTASHFTALRKAVKNILYTVVNSAAMNGFSEKTEIRNVLPEWQIWMICADAAVLVVTVTGVLLIVRRCRKNRSSIQVVQVKAQV